jgi:periplasmic protein TonB
MKGILSAILLLTCFAGKSQSDTAVAHNAVIDSCYCSDNILAYSEQMPQFPGGEVAFKEYLKKKTNNTQGVGSHVYIEFVVSQSGKVCNVRVVKGIPGMPNLDKRAVKIMQESPPWTPGVMNGKNVCVTMTVPVQMPPLKVAPR